MNVLESYLQEISNTDVKIYHYLFIQETLNDILKSKKLLSVDETMTPDQIKMYSQRAIDKKIPGASKNNSNIENATLYWKYVYYKYHYPALRKPYKNYGIYTTPIDFFKFKNRLNIRISIDYKDLPKESIIQLGLHNVKKINSKDDILDVMKKFTDTNKVEKLFYSSKLIFEKLPQIISYDSINVSRDMIEKR